MRWNELKQKNQAPEKGWILAYTRKEVLFKEYGELCELDIELADQDLLEIHLFDKNKEYRSIKSISRRFPTGIIETTIEFEKTAENCYVEEVHLEEKFGNRKIKILNHISYDETNGMAIIDNYRLVM